MKYAILGLGALAAGAGFVVGHEWGAIERAAERDLVSQLGGAAGVRVHAESDGLLGTILGRVKSVTIEASGFEVDGMPFFIEPNMSQSGRMAMLHLRLENFVVRDLPVEHLSADIPGNRFPLGLLRSGVVRLSRSGEGNGSVSITEEGLAQYMRKRFAQALLSVNVQFSRRKVFADGEAAFGPIRRDFEIIADLAIGTKRQLVIARAIVFLDGRRVRDGSEKPLLRALNPVLDIDRDLGLAGGFDMESLEVTEGRATITGLARVPPPPVEPGSL